MEKWQEVEECGAQRVLIVERLFGSFVIDKTSSFGNISKDE
jgi:hypothetical protein